MLFLRIEAMRQKKPSQLSTDTPGVPSLATATPSAVEEYLRRVSFNIQPSTNKHRQIYEFVRKTIFDSLTEKQKRDPLFAALAERIARMSIILDKIERDLWDKLGEMNEKEITERLGGPYLAYMKEYRNFIEALSNLRWAGDYTQKTRAIEKVREITREEVS